MIEQNENKFWNAPKEVGKVRTLMVMRVTGNVRFDVVVPRCCVFKTYGEVRKVGGVSQPVVKKNVSCVSEEERCQRHDSESPLTQNRMFFRHEGQSQAKAPLNHFNDAPEDTSKSFRVTGIRQTRYGNSKKFNSDMKAYDDNLMSIASPDYDACPERDNSAPSRTGEVTVLPMFRNESKRCYVDCFTGENKCQQQYTQEVMPKQVTYKACVMALVGTRRMKVTVISRTGDNSETFTVSMVATHPVNFAPRGGERSGVTRINKGSDNMDAPIGQLHPDEYYERHPFGGQYVDVLSGETFSAKVVVSEEQMCRSYEEYVGLHRYKQEQRKLNRRKLYRPRKGDMVAPKDTEFLMEDVLLFLLMTLYPGRLPFSRKDGAVKVAKVEYPDKEDWCNR